MDDRYNMYFRVHMYPVICTLCLKFFLIASIHLSRSLTLSSGEVRLILCVTNDFSLSVNCFWYKVIIILSDYIYVLTVGANGKNTLVSNSSPFFVT